MSKYFFFDYDETAFECGSGWNKIIFGAFDEIKKYINMLGTKKQKLYNNSFLVVQVKEKFGALRIYTTFSDKVIDSIISDAEKLSLETCELCGKSGKTYLIGRYITLCENCKKEMEEQV